MRQGTIFIPLPNIGQDFKGTEDSFAFWHPGNVNRDVMQDVAGLTVNNLFM